MLQALVFGAFGLIVGSFLNVVILRHNTKSIGGRSGCLSCGARLRVGDLVPVISWLLLRGRCRACGCAISVQYPLVEISTALLFALVGYGDIALWEQAPLLTLMYIPQLALLALLVMIAVYDIRHTIIPDRWVYAFALVAFFLGIIRTITEGSSLLELLVAGPVVALPLFALWAISRGRWMGFGDVKLCLGIGWLLGPVWGIVALFYAFIFGALVSLLILLPLPWYRACFRAVSTGRGIMHRLPAGSYTMKSEVAFGPFLILATLVIWFLLRYQLPIPGMPW